MENVDKLIDEAVLEQAQKNEAYLTLCSYLPHETEEEKIEFIAGIDPQFKFITMTEMSAGLIAGVDLDMLAQWVNAPYPVEWSRRFIEDHCNEKRWRAARRFSGIFSKSLWPETWYQRWWRYVRNAWDALTEWLFAPKPCKRCGYTYACLCDEEDDDED